MDLPLHSWEALLKKKAYPFLTRGRLDDWDHTLRAVEYGKVLAREEGGDPEIILTALVLHDVGWSRVNYEDFLTAPVFEKKNTPSVKEHMAQSVLLAREILQELDFPPEKTESVLRIIAHHDQPEIILSLPEIEATLVFEADRLDRFGPESRLRYQKMFGLDYRTKAKEFYASGARTWFRTATGKKMVRKLMDQGPIVN